MDGKCEGECRGIASLPQELLWTIAAEVTSLVDKVHARWVCKAWWDVLIMRHRAMEVAALMGVWEFRSGHGLDWQTSAMNGTDTICTIQATKLHPKGKCEIQKILSNIRALMHGNRAALRQRGFV